jgi:uncharacterized membrane protein YeaQ/YmgE (transglycosylase-associated protein family)
MLATVALSPGGIIAWLIVGLIAGWLASMVMGEGFGILGDLILGLVGAFIGGIIVGFFWAGSAGLIGSIVVAFIGAVILLWLVRLFTGTRTRARV